MTDRLADGVRRVLGGCKRFVLEGPQPEPVREGEQAAAPAARAGHRLHRVAEIVGASLIGTPMASCLAMASNYLRLGHRGEAGRIALIGLAWQLVLLAVAYAGGMTLYVAAVAASVLGVWLVAARRMGAHAERHRQCGGRFGKSYEMLGLLLISVIPFFLLVLATLPPGAGKPPADAGKSAPPASGGQHPRSGEAAPPAGDGQGPPKGSKGGLRPDLKYDFSNPPLSWDDFTKDGDGKGKGGGQQKGKE